MKWSANTPVEFLWEEGSRSRNIPQEVLLLEVRERSSISLLILRPVTEYKEEEIQMYGTDWIKTQQKNINCKYQLELIHKKEFLHSTVQCSALHYCAL